MNTLYRALTQTLKDPRDARVVVVSACIIFALLLVAPVFAIPGDTLSFQLRLFTAQDYLLMTILSLLAGLTFALQWRSMRMFKGSNKTASAAGGILSSMTGLAGAAMSTVYCGCGIAFFLGFVGLGTGSVLFFTSHQTYFLAGGTVLMLVSLYFAARKVGGTCTVS